MKFNKAENPSMTDSRKKELNKLEKGGADIALGENGEILSVNVTEEQLQQGKDEMTKDGLIKDKNEKLNLEIEQNKMEVNGKKVSDELFKKYKQMYEDYFDKTLSGENHFRVIE